MKHEETARHPSFGVIVLNKRYSNKGKPLFGSSIKQAGTVVLQVKRATLHRSLNYDRIQPEEVIVEVEMSPLQFSESITNMNSADGTPCTIRFITGEGKVADPVLESKREQFSNEFRNDIREISRKMDEAVAEAYKLLNQPSVTKRQRQEHYERLRFLSQCIGSDLPFVLEQFQEQTERTVHEAKCEVDAYISTRMAAVQLEDNTSSLALE